MALSDIRLIQRDPATGKITWSLMKQPKTISGVDKLVQTFAIALLNDPDRDALDPNKGGGLLSMIGQYNYSEASTSAVMDEIYRRLEKAASEVKIDQAGLLNEDPRALFGSYKVIGFHTEESGSVSLKIRLVSLEGTTIDVTV